MKMTMITKNVAEIEEEIRLHGHIEWRSKKNLDEFIRNNTFEKDICIVGYITPRTIQKWGLDLHCEPPKSNSCEDYYVAVKNNRIYYLRALLKPTNDYSRYW